MTTTRRLWLGFGALIAIQIVAAVGFGWSLRAVHDDLTVISERAAPIRAIAYEMQQDVLGIDLATWRYLSLGDSESRLRAARDSEDFERLMTAYERLATAPEDKAILAPIRALFAEYKAVTNQVLAQKSRQLAPDAAALTRLKELRDDLEQHLMGDIRAAAERQLAVAGRNSKAALETLLIDVLTALVILPLLAAVVSVIVGRAIVRTEQILRVTLSTIGDGVITIDGDSRVATMNRVASELTGWSESDALGQPLETVFQIVDQDTREKVDNPALQALREGQFVGFANHQVLIAKDGTERPIDDSAAPIRTPRGEIAGAVLIFRDFSARRDADIKLHDSEQRYRTLFEAGPVAVFACDRQGVIQNYNRRAAELWGREPECGNPAERFCGSLRLYRPDGTLLPHAESPIVEVLRTGIPIEDVELLMERPDQSRIAVVASFSPLGPVAGQPGGVITAFYDISERKELEDELRSLAAQLSEEDDRKNEFLALLAHELRNPLAPISNAVQVLLLKARQGDAGSVVDRGLFEMMERQLGQMTRLVEDLLDVSRISRGRIELRKERTELGLILNLALESVRPLLDAKRHQLTVSLPPAPIALDGDAARLAQVLSNLLNNACKFTPEQGEIKVLVTRSGGWAVIRVLDNGVGISPDQQPRIFGMFMQSDISLNRSQDGLGIGLALVKTLTEMHGGTVEARSGGIGQGSEFVVRLPVLEESTAAATAMKPVPATGAAAAAKARRILVVDDNRASADSLAMLLKLTGHDSHLAYDGVEALTLADGLRPDAILLDIGLPGMNGYEVARRIRAEPWGARVTLIALTGWGQKDDRQRAQDAGFDHHVVKPIKHAELRALLNGLPPSSCAQ